MPASERPEFVLLDLGGVVLRTTGRYWLQERLPGSDTGAIMARWVASRSVLRFESGRSAPREFACEFLAEWGLAMDEEEFLEAFGAWVPGFLDGAELLVARLRERHRVGCLSNINEIHWARFPQLERLFDPCFASYRIGRMKPEPEIYEHAIAALGVAPGQIWFFDDLEANVAAASRLGMRAFRVEGPAELERSLVAQGLLEPAPRG